MVGVDSRRDAAGHSLAALPVSPLALCAQGVGPGLPGTGLPFRGARPGQLLEPAGRLAGGGLRTARFGLRTVVSERADRSHASPCGRGHRRRAARRKPARGDLPAAGRLVAQGRAVRLSHLRPPGGAHPFTIASADRGCGEVRFSIKALGDYTRRLQDNLEVGARVEVEGHTAASTSAVAWPGGRSGSPPGSA